jgi:hypothetical protein
LGRWQRILLACERIAKWQKGSSVAITDGTITTSGTASWWAACGTASLHAHGRLSSAQVVTATNTFVLSSFDIRIPAY